MIDRAQRPSLPDKDPGDPHRLATPRTLPAIIKGASGSHQLAPGLMAMVLFVADLVPLGLQRRIVNEGLPGGSSRTTMRTP